MSDIVLRYIGGGGYIPGVPARDLTAADVAQYGARIAQEEAASGTRLYEPATPAKGKTTKEAAQQPQEDLNNG